MAILDGDVAYVTGAASGIGRACALELLQAGARVFAVDRDPAVITVSTSEKWVGYECDVTNKEAIERSVTRVEELFGSIDILIPAAGVYAASAPLAEIDESAWKLSLAVNTDAVFTLFQQSYPSLSTSKRGGRVILISSKTVPGPGAGAAAYSASKAAAAQLARIAAIEWAADGIRVNMVNPDAVFDTALWTPQLLAERAAGYSMTVEEYKHRNLLGVEVTSKRVAEVVCELCGPAFAATTGAQIPVDGGNAQII